LHGGSVSPDEQLCSADDVIENMMVSREWLQKEFGVETPTIAWQLDIFGHSAGHAQLIKEMGIKSMFFARMPLYQYESWKTKHKLEFMWKPRFLTGNELESESKGIFSHKLLNHYTPESYSGFKLSSIWPSLHGF